MVTPIVCGVLCLVLDLLCSTYCHFYNFKIKLDGEERRTVCFTCLLDVLRLLVFCDSSSQCRWSAVCDCGIFLSYSLTFLKQKPFVMLFI